MTDYEQEHENDYDYEHEHEHDKMPRQRWGRAPYIDSDTPGKDSA